MSSRFNKIMLLLPLPKLIFPIVWDYISTGARIARLLQTSQGKAIELNDQDRKSMFNWTNKCDKSKAHIKQYGINDPSGNLYIWLRQFYISGEFYNYYDYYIALIAFHDKQRYPCIICRRKSGDPDIKDSVYIRSILKSELGDTKWSCYLQKTPNILNTLKYIRDQITQPCTNIVFSKAQDFASLQS